MWLKHNGVFRLKSQSLIDHIQRADLVDRGRCGRRARHNSPHPKTKNDPTVADTFVCSSPTGFAAIPQCGPMYQYEAHWGNQVVSVDCRVPGTL